MKKIAIIGTGIAGIVQALALVKQFGASVTIDIFEKEKYFKISQGVELSVGPGFQIVMQALGYGMTTELETYGYRYAEASVSDSLGNAMVKIEHAINNDVFTYKGADAIGPNGQKIKFHPYSINRGIFMSVLKDKLMMACQGKNIIHWDYRLNGIEAIGNHKVLHFDNGQIVDNVDLVIGADGVHSTVRELLFDQHKAQHVGANILYGLIDGPIDIFNRDKFNIICSDRFSMVSCCYKNLEGNLITWWAIVHPDQQERQTQRDYRAFWEFQSDVKSLALELVKEEAPNSYPIRYIEQTKEFKYAGFFLERNPNTLQRWGIDNVVLVGDAAHAMQPWAGVGASMAAEDGFVLSNLIGRYGFEQLQCAFDELQQTRMDRICYYYQITRNNTPKGILPKDISIPIGEIVRRYGNQRSLQASPAWDDMVRGIAARGARLFQLPLNNPLSHSDENIDACQHKRAAAP